MVCSRRAPNGRVMFGVLAGVGVGAIGASLVAFALSHGAAERSAREVAALQDGSRTTIEQLRDALAVATVERDKTAAEQQRRINHLAAERTIQGERADDQRLFLTAARDAAVEGAALERAEFQAALEQAEADRHRLARERDRAVADREATVKEAQAALRELDSETRSIVSDVERIIQATGVERSRVSPEPSRIRRIGGRGGPYIPWKARVVSADHADEAPEIHTVARQVERLRALRDMMVRLPLVAPVTHAILSDGFGYRHDPINGGGARHEGLDLRAVQDSKVIAPAAGTVISAGWNGAFGNMIEIDHGFGVVTRYAHLSRMLVRKGDVVSPRDQIGVVGATGRVTGVHLHYEIWINGQPRDPMHFLNAVPAAERSPYVGFVRQ